jgi:hypothetical protein
MPSSPIDLHKKYEVPDEIQPLTNAPKRYSKKIEGIYQTGARTQCVHSASHSLGSMNKLINRKALYIMIPTQKPIHIAQWKKWC